MTYRPCGGKAKNIFRNEYHHLGEELRLPFTPPPFPTYMYVPPHQPQSQVAQLVAARAGAIQQHQGHFSHFSRPLNEIRESGLPLQYYHGSVCDPLPPALAPARFYPK